MEKTKDFVNRYATTFPMLILGVIVLFASSCETVDEENLNQLLQTEETTDETPSITTATDAQVPVDHPIRSRSYGVHNRRDK